MLVLHILNEVRKALEIDTRITLSEKDVMLDLEYGRGAQGETQPGADGAPKAKS